MFAGDKPDSISVSPALSALFLFFGEIVDFFSGFVVYRMSGRDKCSLFFKLNIAKLAEPIYTTAVNRIIFFKGGRNMNLPNKLTLTRIVMIPFFVTAMLINTGWEGQKWVALVIFVLSSLTDFADGRIARARGLVTNFGKLMDPLADKLLVSSALICLCGLQKLEAWIVIVIIAREFIISGFRLVAADAGVVIAAGMWGKVKTVFQMIMVILLIADIPVLHVFTRIIVYIATALTIVSLIEYFIRNRKLISDFK